MILSKFFWLSVVLTLVVFGYSVAADLDLLNILVLLFVLDLILLRFSSDNHIKSALNNELHQVKNRVEGFDKRLTEIIISMKKNPGEELTLGKIEESLKEHKEDIRKETKDELDKIAKKAIEIENRISDVRHGFSAAIAAFDDRIRLLETYPEDEEYDFTEEVGF